MTCGNERVLLITLSGTLDARLAVLAFQHGWDVRIRPTPRQLPLRPRRTAEIVVVEVAPPSFDESLRLVWHLREHGAQRLLATLCRPGSDAIETAARASGAGLYLAIGDDESELSSMAIQLDRLLDLLPPSAATAHPAAQDDVRTVVRYRANLEHLVFPPFRS